MPSVMGRKTVAKKKLWPKNEEFVKAWQAAESPAAAAKVLGVSPANASIQASYLRRQGVPLQKFHAPGRARADWSALAALAKKLAKA